MFEIRLTIEEVRSAPREVREWIGRVFDQELGYEHPSRLRDHRADCLAFDGGKSRFSDERAPRTADALWLALFANELRDALTPQPETSKSAALATPGVTAPAEKSNDGLLPWIVPPIVIPLAFAIGLLVVILVRSLG